MSKNIPLRRAFACSALAAVMCASMLTGTTFAWFTDTASVGVNTIQSGTLNVSLQKLVDNEWVNVEGETLHFVNSDGEEMENVNWEPGGTYNLPTLRIVNEGNLSLKYKVIITGINGDALLNEAITWTINSTRSLTEEQVLNAGEYAELTISGYMDENAGNLYQNLTIRDISISVIATQATNDSDSYGNTYDQNATYPSLVTSSQALSDALRSGSTQINLGANAAVDLVSGVANGKTNYAVTITGDGSQTLNVVKQAVNAEGGMLNYQRGTSLTLENMTIQAGEDSFDGIVCDQLIVKNCTIKGKLTLYCNTTFINCTFENDMDDQYSLWTWGAKNVLIEGCTFNTNGKAILLYGGSDRAVATLDNPTTTLTIRDTTFNGSDVSKAAVELGNDYGATYVLVVEDATVNGFSANANASKANNIPTNTNIWSNKDGMDSDHLKVTIDGVGQTTGIKQV